MSSGTYFPPPVGVEIPKAGGGVRVLGVPTVADRVAQTAVAMELENQVEPMFFDTVDHELMVKAVRPIPTMQTATADED
ncbi:hypothetical protein [Williamsia sp.]|uniref:hypothetical protein n=1 Tax=Williamsia sp. TaxID=1872085 RepID=UPI002F94A958